MNSKGYRELEKKYRLAGTSYESAIALLYQAFPKYREVYVNCKTIDSYFATAKKGCFVRIRDSWGQTGSGERKTLKEITVKNKDKGSNLDRREVNLAIDSVDVANELMATVLGEPSGAIKKVEYIFFLKQEIVVSLAKIQGELYVEVEAPSKPLLKRTLSKVLAKMPHLEREYRSLFEIYIEKGI